MELKEGMYVRTDLGISKINTIRKETIGTFVGTDNRKGNIHYGNEFVGYLIVDKAKEDKQWIKDHIKNNITELIEVGDFLDTHCIVKIENTTIFLDTGWFIDIDDVEDLVETIATKEQFEQIQYRIGD